MSWVKRIAFFLLINLAIIVVLTVVTAVFGIDTLYLSPYGLDLKALAVFSVIIGFTGSFISLLLSRKMARWIMKVEILDSPTDPQLRRVWEIVDRLAMQHHITRPQVGYYASPEVNAFATGWGKNHALVAVSAGLLEKLTDDEIEGVVAHEMAHILNGDMVTMALLQGVINTFVIFLSRVAAWAVQKFTGRDNEAIGGLTYWILAIVFEILFGILGMIILCFFSRKREFRADEGSAQLVGKRKMIAALERLKDLQSQIDPRQKSFATLKISQPSARRWLATHPPLESRIAHLQSLPIN